MYREIDRREQEREKEHGRRGPVPLWSRALKGAAPEKEARSYFISDSFILERNYHFPSAPTLPFTPSLSLSCVCVLFKRERSDIKAYKIHIISSVGRLLAAAKKKDGPHAHYRVSGSKRPV